MNICMFLGEKLSYFVVGLTDVSPTVRSPVLWDYDVCGQWPGVTASGVTVHLVGIIIRRVPGVFGCDSSPGMC